MAKAQYHKNQRVYVRPVGTWALVERDIPQWTKGLDEPLRIFYDVGLGREFGHEELQSEIAFEHPAPPQVEEWRIVRARNKWQSNEESAHHPYPGTYPVLITGENEWGGWRVPGAEYALSPTRIERQARLMTCAPRMAAVTKSLAALEKISAADIPATLEDLIAKSREILAYLDDAQD